MVNFKCVPKLIIFSLAALKIYINLILIIYILNVFFQGSSWGKYKSNKKSIEYIF